MDQNVEYLESKFRRRTKELGSALTELYKRGKVRLPGEMPLDELKNFISPDDSTSEQFLLGALSILYILGLITVEPNGLVLVTSRRAHFALGSLSKFLSVAIRAIDNPLSKEPTRSVVQMTNIFENIRENTTGVDKTPLHERRIVNVLIKDRQRRGHKTEDVYLFVYRSDWDQYHLVGYSHYDDTKTEEEVAQVAMQEHLGLRPDQYELDPAIRLSNITKVLISKSNGVKTEYTFSLRVAKSIKVPLNTQDTKKFKWFTWDQILQRKGENGEVIMESTLAIMSNLGNLESIPQCVFPENYWLVEPRESKQYTKLRLTVRDFIITGLIWLIAYVFIFQPFDLINKLSSPIPFISNLAGIIQIVGYFLPITTLPKIYQIIKGYIGPGKTLNKK